MTMLGFEEEDIAGLLTQEIMWEYLTQLRNAQSSLVAYNPDVEEDIFQALLEKYDPENRFGQLSDEDKQQWASESGEQLIKNLETQTLKSLSKNDKTLDFNLKQIAILQKFRNLTQVGKEIKKLQSTINTSSKGLPKSLLELQSKVRQIDNLPFSPIYNAENLLGEYTKDMFGVRLTKPTTINGFASFYGAKFANPLFSRYFPYSQEGFMTAINEVMTHMPNALDKSLAKQTEITRDIFNDIRSFLYANTNSQLFGDDPSVEQRRLFIDVVKGPKLNMSLAKILQTLSKENWFMKNGFLNKLSFDINKNGTISRINFEAATAENLDERNIFDGFLYLLDKNFPVGTFNGIEYTSRTLAQDLVAAAFLEGGNQGAKQYLKYVPASYLKTLGFGNYLGSIPFNFEDTFHGVITDGGELFYNLPSRFTRQYFQNNPDKAKTIFSGDIKGNPKKLENEFSLTVEAIAKNLVDVTDPLTGEPSKEQTKFVSIYDPKLPSKYALYEFDTSSRTYKRLPVLSGSYGFVQYNSNRDLSNPIEGPNQIDAPSGPEIESPGFTLPSIPVQPVRGFNSDVVNNTKKIENAADLVLAKNLSGTGMALDDLLNTLEDAEGVSKLNQILLNQLRDLKLPEGFKVEYIKAPEQKLGGYDYDTKTLQINLNALPNMTVDELAGLVAHELIHTHTGHAIKDYQNGKLDKLTKEQIAIIQKLEALQEAYIQYLETIGAGPELEAFIESYNRWKQTKKGGVVGDVSKLYGAMKLTEFVSMALTDQGFQNHLKNIVDVEGISVWDRIKQMLSELLEAMGLNIPAGSALASTIKSTMDLISETQKTMPTKTTTESFKYYGAYYDIKIVDGVAVDVTNLKKGASETNVKFDERKNKILSAFKENPSVDPQSLSTSAPIQQKTKEQFVEELFIQAGGKKTSKGLLQVNGQHWYIDNGYWKIEYKDGRDELFFYPDSGEEIYIGERPAGTTNFTIDSDVTPEVNQGTTPTVPTLVTAPIFEEGAVDAKYELFPGVYANAGQRQAIDSINNFLNSMETSFLLQGKGGTGKTTIIKKVLSELNPREVLAIAPSHKAKKVLDRSINGNVPEGGKKINAVTLASALAIKLDEATGKFTPDEFKRSMGQVPIKKAKYIIIDESSMVSDKLLAEILQFAPKGAKIIFMGDKAQLPPVGQETDSKVFDIKTGYELREKMRQAATSPIINVGTVVSENVESTTGRVSNPITQEMRVNSTDAVSGSSVIWENNESKALDEFVEDIKLANGDVNYAKIVTFNNQLHNSPQSVKTLNTKVRQRLFGAQAATQQYIPGEILTAYETFSFDQGPESLPEFTNSEDLIVESVTFASNVPFTAFASSKQKGARSKTFNFDINYLNLIAEDGTIRRNIPVIADSSRAAYDKALSDLFKTDMQLAYILKAKFGNLEYGYAITSHKAQGSTYKNVYVMEDNIMGPSNGGSVKAKNQSLYVAVSRPTTKLVMISSKNPGTTQAAAPAKFDPSKLSDPSLYSTPPVEDDYNSEMDDYYSNREDRENYMDDYMNQGDEMLQTSPINRSDYENYLLICGK